MVKKDAEFEVNLDEVNSWAEEVRTSLGEKKEKAEEGLAKAKLNFDSFEELDDRARAGRMVKDIKKIFKKPISIRHNMCMLGNSIMEICREEKMSDDLKKKLIKEKMNEYSKNFLTLAETVSSAHAIVASYPSMALAAGGFDWTESDDIKTTKEGKNFVVVTTYGMTEIPSKIMPASDE